MSVDKGIFQRRRKGQTSRAGNTEDTFDFHEGRPYTTPWTSERRIDRYVPTHCCYCGVQCGMYLKVSGNEVIGVEP
ncbi:MAG TPA: hypothetical protein VKQ36_13465, partial [Ktedonobacterales bacterium]|nr:hypothetical protein [Ktedonobacterales bacterium]